jgi:hypothetical protein
MAVIVETIDQVWLRISSSGSEQGESATSFREIYEQAVDNEETMYMQLEGGVDIENLGDNVPQLVKYPAEVWFGSADKYEADRVYGDVIVEVMPPEGFWKQDKTFDKWRNVPIFNVDLCNDPDYVFELDPSWIEGSDVDGSDEYYLDWHITYLADTNKVKLVKPEEVILSLKTTWTDENLTEQRVIDDFKKIYNRAIEEGKNLYVTLAGPADVETYDCNFPSIIRYPVKVRLGRSGKKAEEHADAMIEVWPPEELWNPKRGFPEGYAVPILNIELKDVENNVMVLESCDIIGDYYREEQEVENEYQDWHVTYRVHTSN